MLPTYRHGPQSPHPRDAEVVEVPFPTFVWTPPTPLPPIPETYRLRVAPLLGMQSPVAALGTDTAFLDVDEIFTNLYQCPISARQFENGRRYASIGGNKQVKNRHL